MNVKKMFGKKKGASNDDIALFTVNAQSEVQPSEEKLNASTDQTGNVGNLQSFTAPDKNNGEPSGDTSAPSNVVEVTAKGEVRTSKPAETGFADEPEISPVDDGEAGNGNGMKDQIGTLSDNIQNLLFDFRSFMSEAGSPFNPNDIPLTPPASRTFSPVAPITSQVLTGGTERSGPGYISAQMHPASAEEDGNPSDIQSSFAQKYVAERNQARPKPSLQAVSKLDDALKMLPRGSKFSHDLKSNLDSVDMPALIRAINSTDYLLHAVGRKNLMKILEVGTREGWFKPEVERLAMSAAEILASSGTETEERSINVSDLLRVVYFLNRLLDPEISEFLSLNSVQEKQYITSRSAQR